MPNPTILAKPKNHPKSGWGKRVGVLLVNLGTPDATDYWSMRRYLKQFLSDPRVIEAPRWLWWLVLNGIILTFRPGKSGHAYASIWDKERNASPLRVITEAQTALLQKSLGNDVLVRFAMRYGTPAIAATLDEMTAAGCDRVLVAPLYPQYAAATTGSVMDDVARWLLKVRRQPAIRSLPPYYDHPAHIDALTASVKAHLKTIDWVPDVIVASFHGLPLEYCQKGDTYYCHSHKTARLLAEKLGSPFCHTEGEALDAPEGKMPPVLLTFQSRFGPREWLQPYTAEALEYLPKLGLKNVLVLCPGFSADCVETLEEIAIAGEEGFKAAGGKNYGVVPCLNASKNGVAMLDTLVRAELEGWL